MGWVARKLARNRWVIKWTTSEASIAAGIPRHPRVRGRTLLLLLLDVRVFTVEQSMV